MSGHRKKKERKLCGDLKVCGTTRTKILKTQNIYPCNPEIPITINGSLNVTENSKICDLSTQNVFPCEGDDIFFNAEVNAKPVLSSIPEGIEPYSVFKAEDPNIPHITLVIAPKGNGALVADKPDGTPVGGNNRGINAVDLQMARSKEVNVASGRYSTISGGVSNTAPGRHSVVCGGSANSALGEFGSVVCGGSDNLVLDSVSIICGGQINIIERSGSFIGGGNFHI